MHSRTDSIRSFHYLKVWCDPGSLPSSKSKYDLLWILQISVRILIQVEKPLRNKGVRFGVDLGIVKYGPTHTLATE